MTAQDDTRQQDSFTIGTPATGGALKCYFDSSTVEGRAAAEDKINWVLRLGQKLQIKGATVVEEKR